MAPLKAEIIKRNLGYVGNIKYAFKENIETDLGFPDLKNKKS